jgi:hypothetical protein
VSQSGEIEGGDSLDGVFVSRDEGDGRGVVAVGQRETGIGPRGDGGGDSGDHLKRNARGGQRGRLFAPPAEDIGVAPLEPDDGLARLGGGDEAGVDFLLLEGVGRPAFAAEGPFGVRL